MYVYGRLEVYLVEVNIIEHIMYNSIEYKSVFCTTLPVLNNSSLFFSVLLIFFF